MSPVYKFKDGQVQQRMRKKMIFQNIYCIHYCGDEPLKSY